MPMAMAQLFAFMPLYKMIVGSRVYDLNVEGSDYDILLVDNYQLTERHNPCPSQGEYQKSHYLLRSFESFIEGLFLEKRSENRADDIQLFFPSQFLINNDNNYLIENREKIIYSNLPKIYEACITRSFNLHTYYNLYYQDFPKRYMYSIYYLNFLIDYYNKQLCEYSIKPEKNMKQLMLAIRKGELPQADYEKLYDELHQKILKLEPWYNSFNIDYKYQEQVKQDLTQLFKEYYKKNPTEENISKENLIWL